RPDRPDGLRDDGRNTMKPTRRDALKSLGMTAGAMWLRLDTDANGQAITVGGRRVTARVASISPHTVRIMVTPADAQTDLNWDGALAGFQQRERTVASGSRITLGELTVAPSGAPLQFR